jgi:putative glycosyltransferase
MRLSVVTTMYASAPHLQEFRRRVDEAVRPFFPDYETVLVDDGSPDESLAIAKGFLAQSERVKIVVLARNFGHHAAMLTGLAHASGDLVFMLDSDLEEPPEVFAQLLGVMQAAPPEEPVDLVYAVQRKRRGGLAKRAGGALFYPLFNLLSSIDLPSNLLNARLMTRRYLDALLRHGERQPLLSGLMRITGYRQRPLAVDKAERHRSTYTWRKRVRTAVGGLISFSDRPLLLVVAAGVLLGALSSLGVAAAIGAAVIERPVPPWLPGVLATGLVGGLVVFSLGIVGLYVGSVLTEVKARPVLVAEVHQNF